jgi:hypothetical protein
MVGPMVREEKVRKVAQRRVKEVEGKETQGQVLSTVYYVLSTMF